MIYVHTYKSGQNLSWLNYKMNSRLGAERVGSCIAELNDPARFKGPEFPIKPYNPRYRPTSSIKAASSPVRVGALLPNR